MIIEEIKLVISLTYILLVYHRNFKPDNNPWNKLESKPLVYSLIYPQDCPLKLESTKSESNSEDKPKMKVEEIAKDKSKHKGQCN